MGATQVNLKEVFTHHSGFRTNFQEFIEQSLPLVESTDARNTRMMSQVSVHKYQSISSLKGKYANDPSWKEFSRFLEEHDRQMNELYKE
jgi:hypothetical protein